LDTNVIVSSALTPNGQSGRIVAAWRSGAFELAMTSEMLEEVTDVLHRRSLTPKYLLAPAERDELLVELSKSVVTVPASEEFAVSRDVKDNKVVEAAVHCGADLVVTNDDDSLSLGEFAGIPFVRLAHFLRTLGVQP
jgi:putative PIN family toxin of toxin-antitoxin system